MPKDLIGNELKLGDLLYVDLKKAGIIARIMEITPGGIAKIGRKGDQQVTPGVARLSITFDVPFDPASPVLYNAVKVSDPDKGENPSGLVSVN